MEAKTNVKTRKMCRVDAAKVIQRAYRNYIAKVQRLPAILFAIQNHLQQKHILVNKTNRDARINSCFDEDAIIQNLCKRFNRKDKVLIVQAKPRWWYDIKVYDYKYGWIPVDIKTTTTLTSDNVGNLAFCYYAYTNGELDLDINYTNGQIYNKLLNKIKRKEYNYNRAKDYYFLVVNKLDSSNVIINSVKGLSVLTANVNNLPFQIKWSKNKEYKIQTISKSVQLFTNLYKPKKKKRESWKEVFLNEMRKLNEYSMTED